VLHTFTGADGANPGASLIQAADGKFYGTTSGGGAFSAGTVFKMDGAGTVIVLHSFSDADGANPVASLIQAADGNFYGTTGGGGAFGSGTVFKMNGAGTVTVLHSFSGGAGGEGPGASLVQATDGNFYGTTSQGGTTACPGFTSGCGTVFRMSPDGTFTVLHTFTGGGTDGANPGASLIQATDGNLYGTTFEGGAQCFIRFVGDPTSCGTVFKMTPSGTLTILHKFTSGLDGANPVASLIQATDGNFYGTTAHGGAGICVVGCGTVFKMDGAGTVTVLHYFTDTDGVNPNASLVQGTDGNFYGTTGRGPLSRGGSGTAFTMTTSGSTLTVLHTFTGGTDGYGAASLIQGTDGSFYGTTNQGGALGVGVVFRVSATPSGNMSFKADFDGDGKSDLAVYRPSTGTWYICYSSSNYSCANWTSYQWGLPGDIPLVADFDGDGKTDLAVWRPSNGTWYIRYSSSNYSYANWTSYQWGVPGDIPLVADFDGDGKTDLAVWRPSNGTWYVLFSSNNYSYATWTSYQWGVPGDVPIPANFDGDHRTDLVVWRPSDGTWYLRFSSSGFSYATWTSYQWGLLGDAPL
jgi:uncharacterized repeat protein (TIGR03803 family)